MINKDTDELNNSYFLNMLEKCNLCPRKCYVNRLDGELGFCSASKDVKIAKVTLHQWEEPCISGNIRLWHCVFFQLQSKMCILSKS